MLAQYIITVDGDELTPELELKLDELEAELQDIVLDLEYDNPDLNVQLESN